MERAVFIDRRYKLQTLRTLLDHYSIANGVQYLVRQGIEPRAAHAIILERFARENWRHRIPEWKSWFAD